MLRGKTTELGLLQVYAEEAGWQNKFEELQLLFFFFISLQVSLKQTSLIYLVTEKLISKFFFFLLFTFRSLYGLLTLLLECYKERVRPK